MPAIPFPVRPLDAVLSDPPPALRTGPVALVFDEDGVALAETLEHLAAKGARAILLFSYVERPLPVRLAEVVIPVTPRPHVPERVFDEINRVIAALPGVWLHYCYNAEFLIYPFCETRSIGEMLAFHAEERRDAMLTYAIDLYPGDLARAPDGVDLADCWLDRSGYYALQRKSAEGAPLDRQWDFHGGLRWRFEEHVPEDRRRLDRIGLFRAAPGLTIRPDHTMSEAEYNTVSCPWHHNLTAAVCSFRVAKALRRNPGSRAAITAFRWHNSVRFDWSSQMLMDLGLMEPGQWF
jgi:hypothetical protein